MTNQERTALQAIANDAGRHAEDRNEALRALGELPPLEAAADPAPEADAAPAADPAPVLE
jgi:hypothetical protein